jgi:DNA-binding NtrC family response regulator
VAALADVERELIAFALKHHGGRMSRVARALGIGRSTLYRKLREYGFDDSVERDAA